jgi:hypothetical protein
MPVVTSCVKPEALLDGGTDSPICGRQTTKDCVSNGGSQVCTAVIVNNGATTTSVYTTTVGPTAVPTDVRQT